jgi:hypothetical protein
MCRSAALSASSKYHQRSTKANAMPAKAVAAAAGLQYSWPANAAHHRCHELAE